MRHWHAVAATIAASLCAVSAFAQSKNERLDMLEERMGAVERQLQNQGLLEMQRQIEALTAEIRRLRGELEQLQNEQERARSAPRRRQ
jgi:septal ring factor EnvC (AmiA/AmiB activator)